MITTILVSYTREPEKDLDWMEDNYQPITDIFKKVAIFPYSFESKFRSNRLFLRFMITNDRAIGVDVF